MHKSRVKQSFMSIYIFECIISVTRRVIYCSQNLLEVAAVECWLGSYVHSAISSIPLSVECQWEGTVCLLN